MAGVPGFEPGLSVLETDVLTVDTIPLRDNGRGFELGPLIRSQEVYAVFPQRFCQPKTLQPQSTATLKRISVREKDYFVSL